MLIRKLSAQAVRKLSAQAGAQAEYASNTHAENADVNQGITINLNINKLNELLEYCSELRTRSEIQEFCGIKSREYFRKMFLLQ